MADSLTVTFSYTVGLARFDCETEVNQEEWANMDQQERNDVLRDAATDDVDNNLEIEEDSIEENDED